MKTQMYAYGCYVTNLENASILYYLCSYIQLKSTIKMNKVQYINVTTKFKPVDSYVSSLGGSFLLGARVAT